MRISDWSTDVCSSDLLAARGGYHRLGRRSLRQVAQGVAVEFDDELVQTRRARLARLAAAADPGRDASGDIPGGIRLVREPVQAVPHVVRGARLRRLLWHPESHDVVVDLVVGGNLDQLDRAPAPATERFHPQAGPQVVVDAVEIVLEVAIALQQTEAARTVVHEARIGRAHV